MPVAVVLVVAVMVGGAGYWAWGYQHRVVDLVRRQAGSPQLGVTGQGASDPAAATTTAGAVGSPDPSRPIATEARDKASRSVLGWAQFIVVSVVVMDATAIVACRRADHEPESRLPRNGVERAGRARRARSTAREPWPLLLTTDETLVLLVGGETQAVRAQALLERWRLAGTILWLRPTAIEGGIEFFDGRRSALRAALLAD